MRNIRIKGDVKGGRRDYSHSGLRIWIGMQSAKASGDKGDRKGFFLLWRGGVRPACL